MVQRLDTAIHWSILWSSERNRPRMIAQQSGLCCEWRTINSLLNTRAADLPGRPWVQSFQIRDPLKKHLHFTFQKDGLDYYVNCCCCVTSVVSDSVRPHRWQPTRLPRPWDSPGKNTGVGCHFLLQCMKVKSERQVTQSCPTLCDPMDCSPPGSSTHGIFQARVLEWGAIAFSDHVN